MNLFIKHAKTWTLAFSTIFLLSACAQKKNPQIASGTEVAQPQSPPVPLETPVVVQPITRAEIDETLKKFDQIPNFPKIEVSFEYVDLEGLQKVLEFLLTTNPAEFHHSINKIYIANGTSIFFDEIRIDASGITTSAEEIAHLLKYFETLNANRIRLATQDLLEKVRSIPNFPEVEVSFDYVSLEGLQRTLEFLQTKNPAELHPFLKKIDICNHTSTRSDSVALDAFRDTTSFEEISLVLKSLETPKAVKIRLATQDLLEKIGQIPKFPEVEVSFDYVSLEGLQKVLGFLLTTNPADFHPSIGKINISNGTSTFIDSVRLNASGDTTSVEEISHLLKNFETLQEHKIRLATQDLLEKIRKIPNFPEVEVSYNCVNLEGLQKVLEFLLTTNPAEFHPSVDKIDITNRTRIYFDTVLLDASSGNASVEEMTRILKSFETLETSKIRLATQDFLEKIRKIPNFPEVEVDFDYVSFEGLQKVLEFLLTTNPAEFHPSVDKIDISNSTRIYFDKVQLDAFGATTSVKEMTHIFKHFETFRENKIRLATQELLGTIRKIPNFPEVEVSFGFVSFEGLQKVLEFLATTNPAEFHSSVKKILISNRTETGDNTVFIDASGKAAPVKEMECFLKFFETLKAHEIRLATQDLLEKIRKIPNFPEIEVSFGYVDLEGLQKVLGFLTTLDPAEIHPTIKKIHISNYTQLFSDEIRFDAIDKVPTIEEMASLLKDRKTP